MKIRKQFKIEMAHIVRNCTSRKCSHSIHGHSAIIEAFFSSFDPNKPGTTKLDNAGMVIDFGLLNKIKQMIESADHACIIWNKDDEGYKDFIKSTNERWIEVPFNPSAEYLSVMFMNLINIILRKTQMNNGEGEVICTGVRYHETATGYAEADLTDIDLVPDVHNIKFSEGIFKEWDEDLYKCLTEEGAKIVNPKIELQVNE